MRFSPIILTALTTVTAFSLTHPAEAASRDPEDNSHRFDVTQLDPSIAGATHLVSANLAEPSRPESSGVEFTGAELMSAERTGTDLVAQGPVDTPTEVPSDLPGPIDTPEEEVEPTTDILIPPDATPDAAPPVEPPDAGTQAEPETTPPPSPTSPTPTPGAQPGTPQPGAQPGTQAEEARVLVAEVAVTGADETLQNEVYRVIRTQAGQTTTRSQLQEDINAIFGTGFFSNVRAIPEDTPLGVRVTFAVEPNPVLNSVQLEGSAIEEVTYEGEEVPLQEAVNDIFQNQYGQIINLRDFQAGIEQLNQVYQDNGYVLAQVIDAPQVAPDGTVTLIVAEGVIEDINISFRDRDGNETDEDGEPIGGRTRDFIILREFETQPGDVFNRNQIQQDLQRAFNLGIFEDLQVALNPGQDPSRVDVTVNVTERQTGSIGASFGLSSSSGLFGAVSLQEQNLGGNNQKVAAEVQVGERDLLFDLSFTDPWIAGDPNRTSYTVNAFGRQTISLIFDGGENEVELANGDRPRVYRLGGGVTFGRPLSDDWRASLGLQYQNVTIRDSDGDRSPRDEFGNQLAFNDSGTDNLAVLQFAASQDLRNDSIQPTSGSVLRLSTEQALPLDGITFNRLRASYSYFVPVRFTRFTEGCQAEDPSPSDCPETLAFNVQAGTILGDLPPYEAFSLGGDTSVRAYEGGEIGSGRSFVQATVEYRFPVFSVVSGVLFADAATDLGTGDNVPGDPAGIRDKPGSGFGVGVGVRVNSPLGQIRVDYGVSDAGDGRFSFGIGERF